LSYVGEPFEYDVFVSYAQAIVTTETPLIRDWSRFVTEHMQEPLATSLNVEGSGKVQVFFDDRVLASGQPLTQKLREKVQHSALLLVLISPLYPARSWCLDELEWFFHQADQDGRSQDHCTVLRIQPLQEKVWPKRLTDERGRPVTHLDLFDVHTELPIHLNNLAAPELKDALLKPFIEIRGKLRSLRGQLEARRRLMATTPQRPADRPVIYLDAAPEAEAVWQNLKGALKDVAIVRPEKLGPENGGAAPLNRDRQKDRIDSFGKSNGLVLLHTGRDDWLEDAVETNYLHRRLLWQRQLNLPWAVLDHVGAKPSIVDTYDVPCVPASAEGWQHNLLAALGLMPPGAGAVP
jgi:hypothetical protein